jgi:hypothetical protein
MVSRPGRLDPIFYEAYANPLSSSSPPRLTSTQKGKGKAPLDRSSPLPEGSASFAKGGARLSVSGTGIGDDSIDNDTSVSSDDDEDVFELAYNESEYADDGAERFHAFGIEDEDDVAPPPFPVFRSQPAVAPISTSADLLNAIANHCIE